MAFESVDLHQQFSGALEGWRQAAEGFACFAESIAALSATLETDDPCDTEHLADAINSVSTTGRRLHQEMWAVLERFALHDAELTTAVIEIVRRNAGRQLFGSPTPDRPSPPSRRPT